MFWNRKENKSRTSRLVALSDLQLAQWTEAGSANAQHEGFARNAIGYRCVRLIAEAAGSIPLDFASGVTNGLRPDHPSLEMNWRALLECLYGDLQVSGNAFLEAVRAPDDRVVGFVRQLKASIAPIQSRDGFLLAWQIGSGAQKRTVPVSPIGASDLLHLKVFDPSAGVFAMAPLSAAAKAVDAHNSAANWSKALMDNAARPSGALIYGKDGAHLTPDQFSRLKEQLEEAHSGAKHAGRPMLLEGGLEWKPMGLSPTDMDFIEARREAAREIALAYGVPPMLLGIPGDNTYSNYREANLAFWRLTLLPLVSRVADALQGWLRVVLEDEELTVSPNLDTVPALAPEREAHWRRLDRTSFLSEVEKRELAGLSPEPRTGGDGQ